METTSSGNGESPRIPPALEERRMQRAKRHVQKLWLPIDHEFAKSILTGIQDGCYDLDPMLLIEDLRRDFGLLTFCLMKVGGELGTRYGDLTQMTFSELFKRVPLATFETLIKEALEKVSFHNVAHSSDLQKSVLFETMTSASTVEVLAESQGLSADEGYIHAILRSLGSLLVVWNYPNICEEVLEKSGESHEEYLDHLEQALGFSPTLLVCSLLEENGVTNHTLSENTKEESSERGELRKLCEIGEALARSNDPQRFPDARQSWEGIREVIIDALGQEGLRTIQQRMQKSFSFYLRALPESQVRLDPEAAIRTHETNQLCRTNRYITFLGPEIRKRFERVYQLCNPNGVSREAVQIIIRELIPSLGFEGGAIYVLDPTQKTLSPRVLFGAMEGMKLRPIPLQGEQASSSLLVDAYSGTELLSESYQVGTETKVVTLGMRLGTERKAGVVSLEASLPLDTDASEIKNNANGLVLVLNAALGV